MLLRKFKSTLFDFGLVLAQCFVRLGPKDPRLVSRRRFFFTVATSVFILASVVTLWANRKVGWFGLLPTRADTGAPASHTQPNQHAPNPAPASITVDTVTLTPRGFEPGEITRSAEKFVLGVDNRILGQQFSFELLREDGHKAHQLKMTKGQLRVRKLLNLPAGRYLLRVAEHPEWTCSIVLSD
jgi:hypothetical protein